MYWVYGSRKGFHDRRGSGPGQCSGRALRWAVRAAGRNPVQPGRVPRSRKLSVLLMEWFHESRQGFHHRRGSGPGTLRRALRCGRCSECGRCLALLRDASSTAAGDAALWGFREAADFAGTVEEFSRTVEYLQLVAAGAVDRTQETGRSRRHESQHGVDHGLARRHQLRAPAAPDDDSGLLPARWP